MVQGANLTRATQKIKDLGQAFVDYTTDHGGRLPLENADVPDISAEAEDWAVAASEEAEEASPDVVRQVQPQEPTPKPVPSMNSPEDVKDWCGQMCEEDGKQFLLVNALPTFI